MLVVSQVFVFIGIWRGSAESARYVTVVSVSIATIMIAISRFAIMLFILEAVQLFFVFRPTFQEFIIKRYHDGS
jgi:hypothetical protein